MRQIKILALCIGLVLIGANTLHAGAVEYRNDQTKTELSKDELRSKVLATYESFVGLKEDLGNNDSEAIRKILKSVGINQPAYYCAAFVCYGYTVNGIKNPKTAWSPSLFPKERCIDPNLTPPLPCDAFGVWFNDKGRIAHAGVVKYWPRDSDTFVSIEGNTNNSNSRNGDGFYQKRRPKRTAHKISRWV